MRNLCGIGTGPGLSYPSQSDSERWSPIENFQSTEPETPHSGNKVGIKGEVDMECEGQNVARVGSGELWGGFRTLRGLGFTPPLLSITGGAESSRLGEVYFFIVCLFLAQF